MSSYCRFAIAGGTGNLGFRLCHALLSAQFTVTVLTRMSESMPPNCQLLSGKGATVLQVDYSSEDVLTQALIGAEVVINCLSVNVLNGHDDPQTRLAHAAKRAGAQLFVPNDWGENYAMLQESPNLWIHPFYRTKIALSSFLEEIELDRLNIFVGNFGSYLPILLEIDRNTRTASIVGPGRTPVAVSVEDDIAGFVVAAFQKLSAGELRNQILHFASSELTFEEMFAMAAEREGSGPWTVEQIPVDETCAVAQDTERGWESFRAFLRLVAHYGISNWGKMNDAGRVGYVPKYDAVDAVLGTVSKGTHDTPVAKIIYKCS